jgi:DNA helicase-4
MDWAQKQFRKHQQILIEMYDFEYWSDDYDYEALLTERLQALQVPVIPVDPIDFINEVFDQNEKDKIVDTVITFISNARTNNITPEMIPARLNKKKKRQYHFGYCAKMLLSEYTQHLTEQKKIDFNDMIYQAITIVKADPEQFYSQYDHMMVDEFQDVAMNHINLIQLFFQKDSSMRLFCVGDDWQSIYSFQGSEPKYFIDFDAYFGKSATTLITENFRCPRMILDAGNQLIAHNKKQIHKEVIAQSTIEASPQIHTLPALPLYEYKEYIGNYTTGLIQDLMKKGIQPRDIMVLCRYDGGAPYINAVKGDIHFLCPSIQGARSRSCDPVTRGQRKVRFSTRYPQR